jgi:hypothetical protein
VGNSRSWLKRYNDATRDKQSAITPATPSHTLAVNVNAPKGWQVSTEDTGLFAKRTTNRRMLTTQQLVG